MLGDKIKPFIYSLVNDLKRMVCSFKFVVSVLALSAITLFTLFDELRYMVPGETPITYIRMVMTFLDFNIVYLLFSAIPSAIVFYTDWENRYIRFSVIRSSKKIYAISKAVSCFLTAFLVVLISEWLLILLLSFRYPINNATYNMDFGIYQNLSNEYSVFGYFAIKIIFKSFCAGFLCVFALWLSTIITNIFVTLSAPLLFYYLIATLSSLFGVPSNLSIVNLSKGLVSIDNSPLLSIVFTLSIFGVLTIILIVAFVNSCRRRIENG